MSDIRIGLIDSGLEAALAARAVAQAAFLRKDDGGLETIAAEPDRIGHGSQVARIIAERAPAAGFANAQVFLRPQRVDAGLLAAAIAWCVEHSVRVINLSLGLPTDRDALRQACSKALAAGVTLVASAPARGGPVFPAAYPGVLAVCGDARCGQADWSLVEGLDLIGADPRAAAGGGASLAAAAVSGLAADFFSRSPAARHADFLEYLRAGAAFVGRERRH